MKILVLNGPPQSGKDTIAIELMRDTSQSWQHIKFATPMREYVRGLFGITDAQVDALKDTIPWHKNNLAGATIRQHMINEAFRLRISNGQGVLGTKAAERLIRGNYQNRNDVIVITDAGGWTEEYWAFLDRLSMNTAVGACMCVHVVKLHRDGCTFEGDSRQYFNDSDIMRSPTFEINAGISYAWSIDEIQNNGTVADAVEEVREVINQFN